MLHLQTLKNAEKYFKNIYSHSNENKITENYFLAYLISSKSKTKKKKIILSQKKISFK